MDYEIKVIKDVEAKDVEYYSNKLANSLEDYEELVSLSVSLYNSMSMTFMLVATFKSE